uniref:NAD(P)(+)--arginine ADP-ribosyltransferase n=1 Tax=Pygocentrus nattereri TaxID=42514 RepID=A0AAR2KH25_PYGNA
MNSTAMMRLFILLILTVHTDSVMNELIMTFACFQITMDLYLNSIDDQFMGCKAKMYCVVTEQLLKNELDSSENFRKDWNAARKKLHLLNTPDSELTETDMTNIALQAYTRNDVYKELNDKMGEGRGTYKTRFGLISLHFLITYGIQTRNAQHECRTTYRRSKIPIVIRGPSVRFGSFASSSLYATLTHFGKETCFIITTCYGADISDISLLPHEAEVLIPPYEVFKNEPVTEIPEDFKDCTRIYTLRSVGKISIMNCEYLKKDKMGPMYMNWTQSSLFLYISTRLTSSFRTSYLSNSTQLKLITHILN